MTKPLERSEKAPFRLRGCAASAGSGGGGAHVAASGCPDYWGHPPSIKAWPRDTISSVPSGVADTPGCLGVVPRAPGGAAHLRSPAIFTLTTTTTAF